MDNVREQRKSRAQALADKDKQIDALQRQIDGVMDKIKAINNKDTVKRDGLNGMFKERDAVRKQFNTALKERDALRDDFRAKNNDWWNYQRALRAVKDIEMKKEKEEREAEEAAWRAEKEAEEAKKEPYEEEQALCDFLADFLERTYLGAPSNKNEEKKSDVVAVKEDPFAGFKPMVKKEEDTQFFGKGKGKKKRNRPNKKQDSLASKPFTLSVDTFDQFGMVSLNPPTSANQVEASVKELRAKKEWYSKQLLGNQQTANEIRKANEKKASKSGSSSNVNGNSKNNKGKGKSAPSKGGNKFSLSSDEFVPLGGAAETSTAPILSGWGQKPVV